MISPELLSFMDCLIPSSSSQPSGSEVFMRRQIDSEIELELDEILPWLIRVIDSLQDEEESVSSVLKVLKASSIPKTRRFLAIFSEIYFGDEDVFEIVYGVRSPLSRQAIKLFEPDIDALVAPVLSKKKVG